MIMLFDPADAQQLSPNSLKLQFDFRLHQNYCISELSLQPNHTHQGHSLSLPCSCLEPTSHLEKLCFKTLFKEERIKKCALKCDYLLVLLVLQDSKLSIFGVKS